ncbi:hypothetical protein, partial [Pseudovibrio axinellae]|uniref:hypothetical protein n=1 Tax=Pseudovibrio axinellae TaxID=989403 RepID=UPI00193CFD83
QVAQVLPAHLATPALAANSNYHTAWPTMRCIWSLPPVPTKNKKNELGAARPLTQAFGAISS